MFRFCFPLLGELQCVTSHGKLAFHKGSALRWVCVDSRRVLDLGSVNWRERAAWLMTFLCRGERSLKLWGEEAGLFGRLVVDGVWVRLVIGEEWVRSRDRFSYWNCMGELKVTGGETGSAGWWGAVGVPGVIGGETVAAGWWGAVGVPGVVNTKLGPADGVIDTTGGVEGIDVAEVDVRLVGGGVKLYDQLHWSWSNDVGVWIVSWLCVWNCVLALASLVGTFDVSGGSLKGYRRS